MTNCLRARSDGLHKTKCKMLLYIKHSKLETILSIQCILRLYSTVSTVEWPGFMFNGNDLTLQKLTVKGVSLSSIKYSLNCYPPILLVCFQPNQVNLLIVLLKQSYLIKICQRGDQQGCILTVSRYKWKIISRAYLNDKD